MISSDQQPNPSTTSTLILAGLGAVREAASIERSVYVILKTSRIRVSVAKKGDHPSSAIYEGHNSKDTRQRTRCTSVSESSRWYCSTTYTKVDYFAIQFRDSDFYFLMYKNDRFPHAVGYCKIRRDNSMSIYYIYVVRLMPKKQYYNQVIFDAQFIIAT